MADFPEDFVATETTLAALNTKVTACNTGACVVSSSALPTGAATSAAQATIIAGLSSIDGHVDGLEASCSSIDGKITACNTGAVVVSSSALPSGAATSALQTTMDGHITDGTQKTKVVDASGNVQPSGDALARSLFVKPGDGTTTIKVVPASTDVAASDPSLAVQLSPNGAAAKALTPQSSVVTLAEVATGANTTQGQFGTLAATHGVIVQAHPTNTIGIRIGDSNTSATRGVVLQPGKALFLPVSNASAVYYCNESAVASKIEVLGV
jgi:hypothetical protein